MSVPQVDITIHYFGEHLMSLLDGLCQAKRHRDIRLTISSVRWKEIDSMRSLDQQSSSRPQPGHDQWRAEIRGRVHGRRFVVDMHDSHLIDDGMLGDTDIYFKRSVSLGTSDPRIVSIGPICPSWPDRPLQFLRLFGVEGYHSSLRSLIRRHWFIPAPRPVFTSGARKVGFVTRLWDPADASLSPAEAEERCELNRKRVEVALSLKKAFGPNFLGGIIPGPVWAPPDVLFPGKSRSEYFALSEQIGVGVSTIGLHGSPPFKLAEYFMQGIPVVSEPLTTRLAGDRPVFFPVFSSVDELVSHASNLLENEELRVKLSADCLNYGSSFCTPRALVTQILERCEASS